MVIIFGDNGKLLYQLAVVLITAGLATAITCRDEKCPEEMNHCCSRGRANMHRYCCHVGETSWVVKIGGVTAGIMALIVLVASILMCYRKCRRDRAVSSLPRPSTREPDLPPDYNSLAQMKKPSEPEPPEYFKLFPLPMYTPPLVNNVGESSKESAT